MGPVVVAIEDSGASSHGICGLFACEVVGQHDLLVVGTIGTWFCGAADFVDCATFRRACHHKRRWKSLGALVDLLGAHCTGALAVQGLDQAQKVSLEAVRVGFLHGFASVLHSVRLQAELLSVQLLHDQRVLLLDLLEDLGQRLSLCLPWTILLAWF